MTRWGVLGCASIALEHVIPAMHEAGARPWALASRDQQRAHEHGRAMGIDRCYGDYQRLIEDSEVDAVYIALPNSLHYYWAKQALARGKSVLLEKPAVLTLAAAEELRSLASTNDCLLVEGFMYRFHDQWEFVEKWVSEHLHENDPALLRVHIGFHLDAAASPDDIRLRTELGGGALFDLGTYAVGAASTLFGGATSAQLTQSRSGEEEIDWLSIGFLVFPGDRVALFDCDFHYGWVNTPVELRTRDSTVVLEHAFNPGGFPTEVSVLRQGMAPEVHGFAGQNAYARMIAEFGRWLPGKASSRFARTEAARIVRSAHNLSLLLDNRESVGTDGTFLGRNS